MIIGEYKIRPRYNEVDQMGYVYHANYVNYCHQARTELLRQFGINDKVLEDNNIMLPVIEMNLRYLKPTGYDEELTVRTKIKELPKVRFKFEFEFENGKGEKTCTATSTVVFVDSKTRKPHQVPDMVVSALQNEFQLVV
ncbi:MULTISPECIES: thioesterase family protein [Labilibaculum]|uniref:YbgC/FadM family acyl-CoA thioesterase n=1 Tax=Labilibaculum euxinus TaxID=2686357 RepID=A0A7M4D7S5_9BACT|nr:MULTISPECIES: thioesterase family protein [Labilibaculum]MBN2598215.1 acyl-CoA thioesterase [Marinifilaceae bacterium]MUP38704.1 YbgC/FadM family acyl-CoA thioesterase [Labilibaculum euxinus]MVB07909.1 YbgC/FadM family acyl-CoA thioesterase [Labilibaculum euxinus]